MKKELTRKQQVNLLNVKIAKINKLKLSKKKLDIINKDIFIISVYNIIIILFGLLPAFILKNRDIFIFSTVSVLLFSTYLFFRIKKRSKLKKSTF